MNADGKSFTNLTGMGFILVDSNDSVTAAGTFTDNGSAGSTLKFTTYTMTGGAEATAFDVVYTYTGTNL